MKEIKQKTKKTILIILVLIILITFTYIILKQTNVMGRLIGTGTTLLDQNRENEEQQKQQELMKENNQELNEKQTKTIRCENQKIKNTIQLFEANKEKNLVDIARLHSELNKELKEETQWIKFSECAYTECNYEDLYALIDVLAQEKECKIIRDLLKTHNLWNGNNQVLFSESFTETNKEITQLNQEIINEWNNLINCNKCEEANKIILNIIKQLN